MADYIWPWPKGTVATQEFGDSPGGVNPIGGHTGIDAALAAGTPLRAPHDGVVKFEGWANINNNPYWLTDGGGICVVIDFGDGMPACIMGHLSASFVNVGDVVKQGQIVAESGNTGRWTTGPHCHLEFLPPVYVMQNDPTYGRRNPRLWCTAYWEDTLISHGGTIKPLPLPYQRDTLTKVWQRVAADHNAPTVKLWDEELRFDFGGYVIGSDPYGDGNKVWFKGKYSDTYFHSSAFKDMGTHDLPDLTPVKTPDVPPPVEKYDFDLELGVIEGIVVEKFPAAIGNFEAGNFPDDPLTAVCHWWNSPDKKPTFEGVVAEFQKTGVQKSAHVVIGENRIGQVVKLTHRAYHASTGGNGWFGLEIDPMAIERNADGTYTARALKIQANVRGVLRALRDLKGGRVHELTLHKLVPGNVTACSELDLSTFVITAVEPDPDPDPDVKLTAREIIELSAEITRLASGLDK